MAPSVSAFQTKPSLPSCLLLDKSQPSVYYYFVMAI
jgi:hypothetical protein